VPARGRHLALSVLLAVLSCPFPSARPAGGLDDSWGFAVQAWATGAHGRVPVSYFTYGPLGFLAVPVVWARTTYVLALLFSLAVQVALCSVLLTRLRRIAPWPVAVVVTLLLAALVTTFTSETLVVVAALVAAAGLALLVKLSTGLVLVLLVVITLVALAKSARRRWLAGLGSVAGALAVCWLGFGLLTRHPLGWAEWLRGSKEISAGYVAMAYELSGGAERADYAWLAPSLVALVLVLVVQVVLVRGLPGKAAAVCVLLAAYLMFREGFTRHDRIHVAILVAALLLLPLGLTLGRRSRWLLVPLVLGPLAYGIWQTGTTRLGDSWNLAANAARTADRVGLVLHAGSEQEAGRRELVKSFSLPAPVLQAVQGHAVHVDPYDTAVVWAYDLRWSPSAVWAGYSSYTPWLDERNAASLAHVDRVLRRTHAGAIDARDPRWESPRYQLELLCRWHVVSEAGGWQVLAPGPNRCGAPERLSTLHVRAGQPITVPDGPLVTMRLQLDLPRGYGLESLLFKPRVPRFARVDGRLTRLVYATAGEPLVVSGSHTVVLPLSATVVLERIPLVPQSAS
jgi:hypothetical protein